MPWFPSMAAPITAPVVALAAALSLLTSLSAAAQQLPPRKLGGFQSWTAAVLGEDAQKVCYAFARPSRSEGVPGRTTANVMLVVTHRAQGRDQVAMRSGYNYARSTEGGDPVQVSVGGTALGFYTAQDSAFARDNRAAVAAFRNGREAVARGPGPNGRGQAVDAFPLAGFGQAHDAISRECPAPRR